MDILPDHFCRHGSEHTALISAGGTNVAATYRLRSAGCPTLGYALPFSEQVRRAVIRGRVGTSHSEAITGKRADGTPLDGHAHAHYFAMDEDRDALIDHITIYAPGGFDDADIDALRSLRTIFRSGSRPDVHLTLVESGLVGGVKSPLFAEALRWRSVTPFSLPRFPNRGGGKPPRPRDLPEGQLRRELGLRGLREPASIRPLEGYAVPGRAAIPWSEFETTRRNGTHGNGLAGFEIEFVEPVRGPIALGFACHFGLGLFLPATDICDATDQATRRDAGRFVSGGPGPEGPG
jgi:CRISPR-associated protein Csb2